MNEIRTGDSPQGGQCDAWRRVFENALAQSRFIREVEVLAQVGSTQDAAREDGRSGVAFIALRQVLGRGRLGRSWADTSTDGVALSIAVDCAQSESLSLMAGVAAAEGVELAAATVGSQLSVGLKWPNDLECNGRKLGGVLIERVGDRCIIGIGINVGQGAFESSIAARAVSLRQVGVVVGREVVVAKILIRLDALFDSDASDIVRRFSERDRMTGKTSRFRGVDGIVEGIVRRIDPLVGIVVETSEGVVHLSAATTSVVVDEC